MMMIVKFNIKLPFEGKEKHKEYLGSYQFTIKRKTNKKESS